MLYTTSFGVTMDNTFLIESRHIDCQLDHASLIAQGMCDTVNGSEGLTDAQRYLHGILFAHGILPNRIEGNEGMVVGSLLNEFSKFFDMISDISNGLGKFFSGDALTNELVKSSKAIDSALVGIKKLEGQQQLKSSHQNDLSKLFRRFINDMEGNIKKQAKICVSMEKVEKNVTGNWKYHAMVMKQSSYHEELLDWAENLGTVSSVSEASRILSRLQSVIKNMTGQIRDANKAAEDLERNRRLFLQGKRIENNKENKKNLALAHTMTVYMIDLIKLTKQDIELKMKFISACTSHLKPGCFQKA